MAMDPREERMRMMMQQRPAQPPMMGAMPQRQQPMPMAQTGIPQADMPQPMTSGGLQTESGEKTLEDIGIRQLPIGEEQLKKATETLLKYKAGKANLEERIIACEDWWKMHHWARMSMKGNIADERLTSAWLFNVIISKHADGVQSYPQPNILPREENDKKTAHDLSQIVPCVLESNDFDETYSDVLWQKLKQGTGVYGIFWDATRLNGLGDIVVKKVDVLNLYWEPGITDIQKSQNVFHVELVANEVLERRYPQLKDKLKGNMLEPKKYIYDDNVSSEGKSCVIDWYYHTYRDGKKLLQYCKYVGDTVIYSSENDMQRPTAQMPQQIGTDMATGAPYVQDQMQEIGESVAETGWYAHGMYPFVFDRLFPVEGSPCGFGYIDVGKSAQEQIDLTNQAIVKNTLMGSTPRFFIRDDGGVNEAEFSDWRRPLVHTSGNLGDDSIRQIQMAGLDGNYLAVMTNKITEMKEVSGNTDASNGITGGVTSASGIAAQQEASGKTSKAATMSAYRAFGRVVTQVIELIRQFYDAPRMFRIMGENGEEQYVSMDNSGMQPQQMGMDFGADMLYRLPVFDVKISAQSKNVYTQNAQNELAVTLHNLGVFNPQAVDQSLMLLDMMDFDGKDKLMGKLSQMGTIYQMFAQVSQIALALAQQHDPAMADQLAQIIMQSQGAAPMPGAATINPKNMSKEVDATKSNDKPKKEIAQVRKAREHANRASEV